jgi:hypothetical protein
MDTGKYFHRAKRLGREVDQLPPLSVEVRNKWSYASGLPTCLYDVDSDYLTFRVATQRELLTASLNKHK